MKTFTCPEVYCSGGSYDAYSSYVKHDLCNGTGRVDEAAFIAFCLNPKSCVGRDSMTDFATLKRMGRVSNKAIHAAHQTHAPACDCGAVKAQTTHSSWCSALSETGGGT